MKPYVTLMALLLAAGCGSSAALDEPADPNLDYLEHARKAMPEVSDRSLIELGHWVCDGGTPPVIADMVVGAGDALALHAAAREAYCPT